MEQRAHIVWQRSVVTIVGGLSRVDSSYDRRVELWARLGGEQGIGYGG